MYKHFILFCTGLTALFFTLVFNIENRIEVTRIPDKVSGAFDALNFMTYQRAYPFENPKDGKYLEEFIKHRQLQLEKSSLDSSMWKTIGPHNSGGRTLALEFNPQNPNTLYAGSASGGLWRSYTMGVGVDGWHYVPTGFPLLAVSSVAVSPADSNIIFIGTGEVYNYEGVGTGAAYRNTRGTYGIGVLKTTDGGITWAKSLDWDYADQKGVWAVKFNPLNPNTVYAVTTEGTYKSYNGGNSWQLIHNVIMGNDIVINNVDTNIVIVSYGNFQSPGYGIYRSSDGGSSWFKITSGIPSTFEGKIHLDILESDPNLIYASIGNGFLVGVNNASWLCKSTDAGLTWSVVSTTDYSKWQGWFSHDVAINPFNSNELIAIGIEIWKSTNGGTTLIQKSTGGVAYGSPPIGGQEGGPSYVHSDAHDVQYHPSIPGLVYFATDGGIFRSTDGGENFESHNGRYQTHQFYNGFSNSFTDSSIAMGGLQDNGTVMYSGSLAWNRQYGGDGSWTAIDINNNQIRFASSQNLNIVKSTNGGSTFNSNVSPPGSGITVFIAPYKISRTGTQVMYGGRNIVYRSTNYGSSWSATNGNMPLDGNPVFAMAISYQTENVLYAATAPYTNRSGIWRTTDGGGTWTNITGSLPDRFPNDIEVDPLNDQKVYVTFSGFGTSHVFKSTNSGIDWTDISAGLPDVPTQSVAVDPNNTNHIYVGNDVGVFASTDGGNSWIDYNEGLPSAVIAMDLQISFVNNFLRVATHGNGAYERKLLSQFTTSVNEIKIVKDFSLLQNYPNPFNPSTKIRFTIPSSLADITKQTPVSLKIYDITGKEIAKLVDEYKVAGNYEVTFNAEGLSSGIYFYQIITDKFSETRKMIYLK